MLHEYLWAVILGAIFCFTLGFGMGANDVSNNFGTSVGSKSLSLKTAIIIAAIFELVGSAGFGASVTDAVRKGVYHPEKFGAMPEMLLFANVTALISSTAWLLLASATGLSVSTTHALIGSMLGCGLVVARHAVKWIFIGQVVLSWILAPLGSMCVAGLYFILLRRFIMRSPNSVKRGYHFLWVLIWIIGLVCAIFFVLSNPLILERSCKQKQSDGSVISESPCHVAQWVRAHYGIAFGIGIGAGTGLAAILTPFVYWRARTVLKRFDEEPQFNAVAADIELVASFHGSSDLDRDTTMITAEGDESKRGGCTNHMKALNAKAPWNADLHAEAFEHDHKAEEMADKSEHFDPRAETFFTTLQIISAAMACLVHGSNDVSNAAAPFASVYSIYKEGRFLTTVPVPIWILFLGGSAIAVGLSVFGNRVIKTVGIELLHVTPCRGFCIEMALFTVMIIASFLGLPLSTTHVAVGAMVGVGLLDRHIDPESGEEIGSRTCGLNFSAINWRVVAKLAISWVGTLIFCALLSAALFAYAIYTPAKIASRFTPCSEWDIPCIV